MIEDDEVLLMEEEEVEPSIGDNQSKVSVNKIRYATLTKKERKKKKKKQSILNNTTAGVCQWKIQQQE